MRVILTDTDILSALAKVGRLPLLYSLFQISELHVTPGVFGELTHSFNMGRQYAKEVFALFTRGQIQIAYLTPDEVALRDSLPTTLQRFSIE